MANKIKKDNKKELVKPDFRGFVNVEIPSELKQDCKSWIREDEIVALEIEEAIASLYKINLTKNVQNDSIIASMQCNDADSPNAGWVLSAHAAHWYDALAVLVWKHRVLLNTNWKAFEEKAADDIG
jgi:hypothetical protein